MKKNVIRTSKQVAKKASEVLKKSTNKKVLSAVAAALVNAKKNTK